MMEKFVLLLGSFTIFFLGTLHLLYTFFSNRFQPRNPQVETEMRNTTPRLTKSTTMWHAWIGFNASHSLGAIYFGIMNFVLVLGFFEVYRSSILLQLINLLTLTFYLFLARKYWFRIPFIGILIATICFAFAELLFYA